MNYNEANKQLIDLNIKLGELNTQLENYDFDFNLLNHKDDIERGRAEHKARKMFEFHKVIEEKTAERGNLIRSLLPKKKKRRNKVSR